MDSEDECTERVETADKVMGHPEVEQVLYPIAAYRGDEGYGMPAPVHSY